MPDVVNSLKRVIIGFVLLTVSAVVTIVLFSLYTAASISRYELLAQTVGIVVIVAFGAVIFLFIRRSNSVIARNLGDQAATVLQFFMLSIALLIMIFAVLDVIGVSPEVLVTGAGFASITIGLIVSTFVGGVLGGGLVFMTHKLRVGDSVVVNNVPGTVTELSLLVTRIRTDMGVMTIPNNSISSGAIVVTRLQKVERIPQQRLPYHVGDRVVTTYMAGGEGTVKELTALRTVIALDSGRELTFLNSSVLTGIIGVAKLIGNPKKEAAST